jgi:replication factor A2
MQTGAGGSFAGPNGGGMGGAAAQGGQYAYQATAQAEAVGSPCQNSVLECIKQSSDEQGVSITSICESLAGRFQEPGIREALDFLSNEGHVYSTIDDEHYRSTDA